MRSSARTALLRGLLAAALVTGVGVVGAVTAQGADPCQPVVSPVACENTKPGNPKSEWDISGSGSSNLQGFATDISVNVGQTVRFKVSTPARSYRLDIYRLGYYAGNGARKVATVAPSASLPQNQPNCLTQTSTGLVDCGNWGLSASWQVPADAVSGIYIAKLVRTDGTSGSSHIVFVVRDDNGGADILFQTSDTTWQAYNQYGGNSLYTGSPAGRAYKVSYNRPFTTRGYAPEDWVFNAEYPMVRWLEANGYDVSYATDVDTDRRGVAGLTSHEAFLSVGHDEYWSGGQRANVEAARDAGVNLGFFSGNEVFWKTRWENSIDSSGTPYRTLVSYKETHANAKIDPNPAWTGTWRDPRFSPPADGGRPENALTGTIFKVNSGTTAIQVPSADGKMRFWRGTSVANLAAGATATLSAGTLGYEWDEDADNGFRPGGLVRLSTTTASGVDVLQDYGSSYGSGSATHHLTLYRAASGALVFGAGTIQWPWGLDSVHDRGSSTVSTPMRQATVNLLADMGVQPVTLQSGLAAATASTDSTGPQVSISSPAAGSSQPQASTVPVTGTATDAGGQVGAVEVSKDGGTTWHPATGRSSWSYNWSVGTGTSATLLVRAADDSGNIGAQQSLTVTLAQPTCPCTIWDPSSAPQSPAEDDNSAIEVGVKFRPAVNGTISAIRFYKGSGNTGTHVGHLWTAGGQQLAAVNFTGETATGWQQANLANPVTVTAGTTYVASYYAPVGRYAEDEFYFQDSGVDAGPIRALRDAEDGPNGVYRYGSGGGFPSGDWRSSNYWVDVVFNPAGSSDVTPPAVTARTPAAGATGVAVTTAVSATFNEALATPLPTVAMTGAGGSPVAGSTSYDAATRTVTFQPSGSLAYSTVHNVTITGARDAAGNITPPVTWSFTTAAAPPPGPTCPCTIWPSTAIPGTLADPDNSAIEVGVKFRADVSGFVTGVRFYKSSANTGTHLGRLWSASGTQLASGTFTGETASGWQTLTFATPVAVTAGATYVASYYAPVGRYSVDEDYFSSAGTDNAPLHALADGIDGGNGVYRYGSGGGFPTSTYNASNYWVDVVFTTTN
jgi:hypothetical protein